MDGDQLGRTRTEQDVIVTSARDASTTGITGWRVDEPGGRVFPVLINVNALYESVFELIEPIMTIRLHRVKRVPDASLATEIMNHTAAVATHFCKCCYQQMRESASLRHSPIVQEKMNLNLYITRAHFPSALARMIAGFGPIFIGEGHLKNTMLVPYISPGTGDLNHNLHDQTHPWIEDMSTLLTAMTTFRLQPEIRVTDVDFTSTEGSAFWTIWSTSSFTSTVFEGFCSLPESFNSDVDKLLAAIIRRPLFEWPETPLIPIDWSTREFELPQSMQILGEGDMIYGSAVSTENLSYWRSRQFYFPCELLVAQVVRRPDHALMMVQPQLPPPPTTDGDSQMTETQAGKRPRTDTTDGQPSVPMLAPTTIYRVRVGYAGFYGSAFDGVTKATSFQLFFKALALI